MNPKESILEILAFNPIHTSNVKAFMTYIRELLEKYKKKKHYPTLNFYCNWAVHPKITRSKVVVDMFESLTRSIAAHNASAGATGNIWNQINNQIGISRLKTELMGFMQELSIPIKRFEDTNYWKGFVGLMFQKLKDKPLLIANVSKQEKIYSIARGCPKVITICFKVS